MNARAANDDNEKVAPDSRYNIEAVRVKNGDKVEMKINPSLGLGFASQIDADTGQNFNASSDSLNEEFRQSQTYSENLPEEYEPLIKQYFEALSS